MSQPAAMQVGITGASGFIGARLAEMLGASGSPARPRILSRRGGGEGNTRRVDFQDPASIKAALAGCSAVVHCAFDFTDIAANIALSRAIAAECTSLGARLVHVSTAAVYEPLSDGKLDEASEPGAGGTDYKHAKLAIEDALRLLARETGLDVVILQPTIVFGPRGRAWTDSPIRELLTGTVILPNGGRGLCNAVYVDDVCQAIVAALTAKVPSGERFLVSGPSPVPWKEFYGAYQDMLGLDAIRLHDERAASGPLPSGDPAAPRRHAGLKRLVSRTLGAGTLSTIHLLVSYTRATLSGGKEHRPSGAKLDLLQARCHVRIEKARRMLGYEPRFDLARGMQATAPYVLRTYRRLAQLRKARQPAAQPTPATG